MGCVLSWSLIVVLWWFTIVPQTGKTDIDIAVGYPYAYLQCTYRWYVTYIVGTKYISSCRPYGTVVRNSGTTWWSASLYHQYVPEHLRTSSWILSHEKKVICDFPDYQNMHYYGHKTRRLDHPSQGRQVHERSKAVMTIELLGKHDHLLPQ